MDLVFNPATFWWLGVPLFLVSNILLYRIGEWWLDLLAWICIGLWCMARYERSLQQPKLTRVDPFTLRKAAFQIRGALGDTSAIRYRIAGELPPGLVFDEATGMISGTPQAVGRFEVEVGHGKTAVHVPITIGPHLGRGSNTSQRAGAT